jgi:hypothetical protein
MESGYFHFPTNSPKRLLNKKKIVKIRKKMVPTKLTYTAVISPNYKMKLILLQSSEKNILMLARFWCNRKRDESHYK